MTEDYEMLVTHKENKPLMAYLIMEKYKPLIRKRSKMFSSITRHEIDSEDIASESYFKLIKFLDWVTPEKANPDTFSFTFFVRSSVKRAYLKLGRTALKTSSIHDENFVEPAKEDSSYNRVINHIDRDSSKKGTFTSRLNPRQKNILKLVKEGKEINEISSTLCMIPKTIHREIRAMRREYIAFVG